MGQTDGSRYRLIPPLRRTGIIIYVWSDARPLSLRVARLQLPALQHESSPSRIEGEVRVVRTPVGLRLRQ